MTCARFFKNERKKRMPPWRRSCKRQTRKRNVKRKVWQGAWLAGRWADANGSPQLAHVVTLPRYANPQLAQQVFNGLDGLQSA
jgi:hypothetical protein